MIELCIEETNKVEELKDWFSANDDCYSHRVFLLDFLILILLRKHCIWWTEKIIEKEKRQRYKNKLQRNENKSKRSRKLQIVMS